MAESPKSYSGYDSNGQKVSGATARNATDHINPQDVAKAIEKINTVATEEINRITTAIAKLTDDTNEAIIVQGTKMTATFEDVNSGIKEIPKQIVSSIEELKTMAEKAHDDLQRQFNEAARNACYGNGVVDVRQN